MMTCVGFAFFLVKLTCTPLDAPVDQATFCRTAEPIQWHASNPRWQKEQIDRHNAKYRKCRK